MNQLAQEGLAELGNDAPDVRVLDKGLDALDDLGNEAVSDLRHPFFGVPCLNSRQIAECGLGEADLGR